MFKDYEANKTVMSLILLHNTVVKLPLDYEKHLVFISDKRYLKDLKHRDFKFKWLCMYNKDNSFLNWSLDSHAISLIYLSGQVSPIQVHVLPSMFIKDFSTPSFRSFYL